MEQEWKEILKRYGQSVSLCQGEQTVSLRAFVQPALSQDREQEVSSPLGLERLDQFLYLGPEEHPLDLDTVVRWRERDYRVQSAHLVGEGICPYWWAMLYPREEVEP